MVRKRLAVAVGSPRGAIALAAALAATVVVVLPGVASAGPNSTTSLVRVSGHTPFAPGCEGVEQSGLNFLDAEVEPRIAADPTDPQHLVGVWQQDRWSNGAAHGLGTAVSRDGGQTWTQSFAPFSICAGGTHANSGGYERAADPWVTFAPDGTVYQISLSFNDSNTAYAILVSRSTDGGSTWSDPAVLSHNQPHSWATYDDKGSITADPRDSNRAYAVWDRSLLPSYHANPDAPLNAWPSVATEAVLSRTTDGGATWEAPRVIWTPHASTTEWSIGNIVAVLPNGHLVNVMLHVKNGRGTQRSAPDISIVRSTDFGVTWSKRIVVSKAQGVEVTDPETGQDVRTSFNMPDISVDPVSGALYAVWEDAQFSQPPTGHSYAGIAFSMSTDEGITWSTPIQINQAPSSKAFTPSVAVAADGTVGVAYYDFRNNTPEPGVPTDYWLVHCHADCTNPASWSEHHISGPFDIETAPYARGLFLGDYEGLTSVGNDFLAFFAQTNTDDLANRTDVFAARLVPQP